MLFDFLSSRQSLSHRDEGDRRRAEHDWAGAADAYESHLDAVPEDQPIWVQLGHARKEQGLLSKAADAYQAAVDRHDRDADANRHLADVLMRLDREDEALAAYQRANDIEPDLDTLKAIRRLRKPDDYAVAEVAEDAIFLSLQDLFGYLRAHVTMSGIQRVQAGVAMHVIENQAIPGYFILGNTTIGGPPLMPGEFWMIDSAMVARVITYASGETVSHETLREMLLLAEVTATRVRPAQGHTLILLGAFWGLGNGVQHFLESKRAGVRIGAYVYDIIPVTHPEFCDDALVIDFSRAICELCAVADFILTISDATQQAVRDFIAHNGGRPIAMATVPLAHHLTRETSKSTTWPEKLARVRGRRYVAYVSTIEGRKNHIYVVNAWRRLIAEGVNVPELVFVGRPGWKISALNEVLTATDNLNGQLHIAHDLSDGELNLIYANCEFSVFTSIVEGWGLPVGESLFHGRPCVASNTSSIPEVGGDLVDYINPSDLDQGVAVLKRMIVDKTYRESRVDAIRQHFAARTWQDVGADFFAKVATFLDRPIAALDIGLPEGQLCHLQARIDHLKDYFERPDRLLLTSNYFYASEDHGIWMRSDHPEITLITDQPAGTPVTVYLMLTVSPGALQCALRVIDQTTNDQSSRLRLNDLGANQMIRLAAITDGGGRIRLRFDISGSFTSPTPGDHRTFAIGFRSIAYARPANIAARQDVIERMTMCDLAG